MEQTSRQPHSVRCPARGNVGRLCDIVLGCLNHDIIKSWINLYLFWAHAQWALQIKAPHLSSASFCKLISQRKKWGEMKMWPAMLAPFLSLPSSSQPLPWQNQSLLPRKEVLQDATLSCSSSSDSGITGEAANSPKASCPPHSPAPKKELTPSCLHTRGTSLPHSDAKLELKHRSHSPDADALGSSHSFKTPWRDLEPCH